MDIFRSMCCGLGLHLCDAWCPFIGFSACIVSVVTGPYDEAGSDGEALTLFALVQLSFLGSEWKH